MRLDDAKKLIKEQRKRFQSVIDSGSEFSTLRDTPSDDDKHNSDVLKRIDEVWDQLSESFKERINKVVGLGFEERLN